MSRKNINFDDKKIRKSAFYKNKTIDNIENIDVNNILVSKKEPYRTKNSFKYFIGSNDNDIIRPLCIRLPQMTGYVNKFNENATMSFRVTDKQLLKNYNKIWRKVEQLMKIDFESKLVYGDDYKCIKTKIKIYADSVITNFHNKRIPKEKAPWKCLSIITIDPVIKANKKNYPQTLLEECKYLQEKIKIENYISEDLEKIESDSDSNNDIESDVESNNETESDIDNEE